MKIVLIDNYDSFTFNLARYFNEASEVEISIMKNDQIDKQLLEQADKLVISPGPGLPSQSGSIISIIKAYSGIKPIFGVCLGLQAIYEAFGGRLINLDRVFHGVSSTVTITQPDDEIFKELSNPFLAGRYHSWVCDPDSLPDQLQIMAWDEDWEIMVCRHRDHPTYGVQFHPESILTPEGNRLIRNFIRL